MKANALDYNWEVCCSILQYQRLVKKFSKYTEKGWTRWMGTVLTAFPIIPLTIFKFSSKNISKWHKTDFRIIKWIFTCFMFWKKKTVWQNFVLLWNSIVLVTLTFLYYFQNNLNSSWKIFILMQAKFIRNFYRVNFNLGRNFKFQQVF